MSTILELTPNGDLTLSAELLQNTKGQTRYRVDVVGDRLIISAEADKVSVTSSASPSERASEFRN